MTDPKAKVVRRPYPQVNAFRPFVMDELRRRKTAYPNPISAPFVRLTSCKHDPANSYVFFTLGLHGFDSGESSVFDLTYGGGRDIVGYASDLTSPNLERARKRLIHSGELSPGELSPLLRNELNASNPELLSRIQEDINRQVGNQQIVYAGGAHPIPGITGVQVKRSGIGTPLIATVRWSCYNRTQLEFLRNHFMVAGGYCVIEFGQNFHDRTVQKVLDFTKINTVRREIANCILKGRKYVIDEYVEPNGGNYDFLCGTIGNFQVDMDAKTGVYNCTTTIVSVGEEMWGLSNQLTMVRKSEEQPEGDILKPSSFQDFFKIGGMFDATVGAYIGNASAQRGMVAVPKNGVGDRQLSGEEFSGESQDSRDYRFVSWEFVCRVMIPRMFELINDAGIKTDVQNFIKFYVDKSEDRLLPFDEQAWVGNNKDLRSTDPDIMLLIKSDMRDVPPEFTTAGYFDDFPGADGFRGKLRQGVWINTGMIRNCFLQTLTFEQAIKSILIRLNSATAGFWKLQMFFDDEEGRYKIIDTNLTDGRPGKIPAFYKFNTAGKGELLNVNLDSSFPPELVTQMMLYAKFRSENQTRQQDLLKRYPAIGTTSTFALALNWTSLVDIVHDDIDKARENQEIAPLQRTDLMAPAQGTSNVQTQNERTVNRISGGDAANLGAGLVSSRTNPAPGTRQAVAKPVVRPDNRNAFERFLDSAREALTGSGATRNSAKPPAVRNRPALVQRADRFKDLIEAAGRRHGVDPDVIRAVIATESGFAVSANRQELLLNDSSRGLMQILVSTARGLGFNGTQAELALPENNIEYGTRFIASCLRTRGGDLEDAISMYNGGFRPRLAFGQPAGDNPTPVCIRWSQTQKRVCEKYYVPAPGQYGNQPHVNRFMTYYNMFRADAGKPPFVGKTTNGSGVASGNVTFDARLTTPSPSGNSNGIGASSETQDANAARREQEALDEKGRRINRRFGTPLSKLIALSESTMRNLITRDGYRTHPKLPNGFVCPFPTTTAVEVELQGISGISISDGFIVDRLPFIFERYGVFQVTQIQDTVTESGWTTKVQGYFKMMYLNGDGPNPEPET